MSKRKEWLTRVYARLVRAFALAQFMGGIAVVSHRGTSVGIGSLLAGMFWALVGMIFWDLANALESGEDAGKVSGATSPAKDGEAT